ALIPAVAESIRGVIKHDYASLALREGEALHMYPLVFPLGQQIIGSEAAMPLREAAAGRAILDRETKFFNRCQLAAINSPFAGRMLHAGVQSLCCVPLQGGKGILGTLNVGSTKQKSLDPNELGSSNADCKPVSNFSGARTRLPGDHGAEEQTERRKALF